MALRMTPERAIELMEHGETPENKAEYQKAYQLALEAMRYWSMTSFAAKQKRRLRARLSLQNIIAQNRKTVNENILDWSNMMEA